MKRTVFISIILALPVVFSCKKDIVEENLPLEQKAVSVTALKVAPGEATKTAFVGGVYMWKTNDDFVVRSNNANGYSTFEYSGDDTAGSAQFTINSSPSEDKIVTGNLSFAVYPANTSGSGAEAFPREDEGSLKIVLKNSYNWAEGNVKAPMLAKIPDDPTTEALEFKHLGGVLKLTYKNVPPKAAKLIVSAPAGEGECYKICDVMKKTWNWDSSQGGFTGDTPYLQAYVVSGNKEITQNISSATAEQRTSADGLTVYVPLPVGPGNTHVYPKIKIRLAFNDGTTVPGSERTASNVKIERAVIKKMEPIALTKYTVETLVSSLARTPHGMTRINDNRFVVTGEQYHVFFLDIDNKTATQSAVKSASKYPQYPYGVCAVGNNLWIANKVGATGNGIYKYDMTTEIYSIVSTGINQPMQIKEHNGSIYVLGRGDGSSAGKIYVFENGVPGEVSSQVYADFGSVSLSTGYAWPQSFDFDTDGSMVVAVSASSGSPAEAFKLYRVASKGATPVALFGKGVKGGSYDAFVDGISDHAVFSSSLLEIAFDGDGNLYIADMNAIRKLVRGTNGLADGTLVTVTEYGAFSTVDGMAFDSTYKHLYVSDKTKKSVYKVTID